jgi:hypothetical protein
VALQKDGTRLYSDIGRATYTDPEGVLAFECPAQCQYVWLVVSGAPTNYWTRDWLSWDSNESTAEQWPYRVKLYQTNVYGKPNNNTLPTDIEEVKDEELRMKDYADAVYDLSGRKVSVPAGTDIHSLSSSGLPRGIYIVRGRRVVVK